MSRRGAGPGRAAAFTLLEMLVVAGIAIAAMGLVVAGATIRRDERRAAVQGAAAELAATLRQARAYAMDRNVVAAVSFNIENAPGSSGWTLNNRSGGHWYRIIGPAPGRLHADTHFESHYPFPLIRYWVRTTYAGGDLDDAPFRLWLETVDSAWYGDRHVLPRGKARFLAIGDQDNGARVASTDPYQPAGSDYFYPRPWFGRWDPAQKRLHPWGGYEPALKDFVSPANHVTAGGTTASFTGFFYEGRDGTITGSANPADRGILDDTNGDGHVKQAGADADDLARQFPLYVKDRPRPLIDAAWLDLHLVFNPDGSVSWGAPLAGRREWGNTAADTAWRIGPGERISDAGAADGKYSQCEVGNYSDYTGAWFITLGPDLPDDQRQDQGSYDSVQDAIAAMMPMFRVYVTAGGEVGWFEVRRALPDSGVAWHPLVNAAAWKSTTFLKANYPNGTLREKSTLRRIGAPVTDFLVPEMLADAKWWLQ